DETTAAAVARGAVNELSRVAINSVTGNNNASLSLFPPTTPNNITQAPFTGEILPLRTCEAWDALRGSLIFPQDARYAFVPLYKRDGDPSNPQRIPWSGTLQVFVIVVNQRTIIEPRQQPEFNDLLDTGRGRSPSPIPNPTRDGTAMTACPNNLYPHQ